MELATWLPPAVIITVLGGFNTLTTLMINKRIDDLGTGVNKRIDDLRDQMKYDHQNLANHLTRVENKLDTHIGNYEIHDYPSKQSSP